MQVRCLYVRQTPPANQLQLLPPQGINFNIKDPVEVARWQNLYLADGLIDYKGRSIKVIESDGIDRSGRAA
jgi:hypothetical protein